ncbi:MAG: Anthranilate/para-aminobenzoate synthase component II TrpG [Candidatus Methanohalarchaeum thermophilum]|uniref:anthranilate synthase n=1 Tax=Methanohalarchaeum thermophilum TaxID=1903181 RepID=A0A1Q6DSE2_METT1|nr:MAG: Anthranilate/para-aminobenzoate synthase component II TrpG [Candidatus Methanohalarchaeum thermophilum]
MSDTLLVDCYDSFTYNLYQQIGRLDREPKVVKNDEEIERILDMGFERIVFSPGPGKPEDSGVCRELVEETNKPILGVCLGHQVLVSQFKGKVVKGEPIHGKKDRIFHDNSSLFKDLPQGFQAGRYHSLIAQKIPSSFQKIAETRNKEIMAVRHRKKPLFGIQFHTESILTPLGDEIIKNFLQMEVV